MRTIATVGPITIQIFESKSGKILAMIWDDDSMDNIFSQECETHAVACSLLAQFLFKQLNPK